MRIRTQLKAGKIILNHSESLKRQEDREAISMRRTLLAPSPKEDRLELLVVRAGVRAGAFRRGFRGQSRRRI